MERQVWDKVRHFLELLRCENIDRESIVDTKEFQEARKVLSDKNTIYQQSLADIQQTEQEKIKDYVEALKSNYLRIIGTDRNIGTWKALNIENSFSVKCLNGKAYAITFICQCEGSAMVPMKQ